jgi:hypothetical protein
MSRKLPPLGQELAGEIENHWNRTQPDWARKRLLVVRLIGQHEHTVAQIVTKGLQLRDRQINRVPA